MDLQAKDSQYSTGVRTFTMIITARSVREVNLAAGPTFAAFNQVNGSDGSAGVI
jgi:hypothetical protein